MALGKHSETTNRCTQRYSCHDCRSDCKVEGVRFKTNLLSGIFIWDDQHRGRRKSSISIFVAILSLGAVLGFSSKSSAQSASTTGAKRPAAPAIVIGFVGGFIRHDNPVHSEVQLAARLRKDFPTGVDVETFESYRGAQALERVLHLLDRNHDGTLTPEEKREARIILYGHSWGGAQAILLARQLGKNGIPVLLTIQVDSITRILQNDAIIPANVAQAANFYQPSGLIHGQSKIRAEDPARTKILGNFRFDYSAKSYDCTEYPWYDRIFVKAHTQIECDPNVWKRAEDLIRSQLSSTAEGAPGQPSL